MKLFLVDDSATVRERLATASREVPGLELIGWATKRRGALDDIRRLCPDIVILDIQLVDGTSFCLLQALKRETPDLIVIMFTSHDLPQYRANSRRAGADYFFEKTREFTKLTELLRRLALRTKTETREPLAEPVSN